MKKIYLIKKYPSLDGKDNWLILNGSEFIRFKETEEGKKRSANIFRVPYGDPKDPPIFAEVDPITAKEWSRLNNRKYYRERIRKEQGVQELPSSSILIQEDERTMEDLSEDLKYDVEAAALHLLQVEALYRALDKLNHKERRLINALYLSDQPMTEEHYSEVIGTSRQYVHKYKQQILKKLRGSLEF